MTRPFTRAALLLAGLLLAGCGTPLYVEGVADDLSGDPVSRDPRFQRCVALEHPNLSTSVWLRQRMGLPKNADVRPLLCKRLIVAKDRGWKMNTYRNSLEEMTPLGDLNRVLGGKPPS